MLFILVIDSSQFRKFRHSPNRTPKVLQRPVVEKKLGSKSDVRDGLHEAKIRRRIIVTLASVWCFWGVHADMIQISEFAFAMEEDDAQHVSPLLMEGLRHPPSCSPQRLQSALVRSQHQQDRAHVSIKCRPANRAWSWCRTRNVILCLCRSKLNQHENRSGIYWIYFKLLYFIF